MKSFIIKIASCITLGVLMVSILFGISDKLTHEKNNFHRFFPPHPIEYISFIDLTYNSYYFAGSDSNKIYLSNLTAPLHLLEIDPITIDTNHYTIKVNDKNPLEFSISTRVSMLPPYFYIVDGVAPRILRGILGERTAKRVMYDSAYFNDAIPVGPKSFALRTISAKTNENILGKESDIKPHVVLNDKLLEKQVDGIFCTDGMFHYNKDLSQLIYLYHYRNEYMVMDTSLTLLRKGRTIDTNTIAKIKIATVESNHTRTISEPPVVINKNSYTYGIYLLVHSGLMAKNENKETFKEASVIDVYNIISDTYEFSIYIYPYRKQKLTRFMLTDKYLLGLHNQYLVIYNLNPKWFKELKSKPNQDILSR